MRYRGEVRVEKKNVNQLLLILLFQILQVMTPRTDCCTLPGLLQDLGEDRMGPRNVFTNGKHDIAQVWGPGA